MIEFVRPLVAHIHVMLLEVHLSVFGYGLGGRNSGRISTSRGRNNSYLNSWRKRASRSYDMWRRKVHAVQVESFLGKMKSVVDKVQLR